MRSLMFSRRALCIWCALCLSLLWCRLASADEAKADDEKTRTITLGKLQSKAPADWKRQEPKSRIVAYEFSAPAAPGDKAEGRFTVMAAGGSVQDNIDRWYGQFVQPDGKSTKERAKVEKKQIAGQEVHIVDMSGTYKDSPGPFAEGVNRENYRMLAAIIVTDDANFFFKFYGPRGTIAAQEKAFHGMLDSLSRK